MEPNAQRDQAVRRELDTILSSSGFVQSKRLTDFLRFVVERHLDGKDDELKETLLAIEVFGRRADYDPKQDSIVRTEAGRLRSKLIEYYAGEGRNDTVVIELPKGRYAPVFHITNIATAGHQRTVRPRWSRIGLLTLTLASAVIAVIGYWWGYHKNLPIEVAVLPLKNLSPDPANEYFVDGLTDEIIRQLSVIEGLAVRSRTSSFAFKNAPRNLGELEKQLAVDYIVEGSVLREGRRLRINAQLVRARDDFMLWSGRFDRELTDIFAIQDEISRGVVNNLRLRLGHTRRRYETSVEAYDLYLQAQALPLPGPPGIVRIGTFEQAIEKDPSFAPAYAGLASTYAMRSIAFPENHSPDELQKMRAAAEKAIELDPLLAEAHEALALVYSRHGQWKQAEKSFRYAIQLDPNRSITYTDFARYLLRVLGRNDEAIQLLRIAEHADPLSPEVQSAMGILLIAAGRFNEADEHCHKMSADDALKKVCLARVQLGQENFSEAIQLLIEGDRNPNVQGFLGYAYARAGHRDQAEKMAAASVYANENALIFAGLGDKERTFEALDQMAVLGPQRVGTYINLPELALLRGDPRLKAFRKKVGLPD
ncbi:MAG TPA: tetratricopeptide repeat protein [Blastocatellia bacterium]|nr:tetratricopeptide repeat protein [Blastocatellia bacterium]